MHTISIKPENSISIITPRFHQKSPRHKVVPVSRSPQRLTETRNSTTYIAWNIFHGAPSKINILFHSTRVHHKFDQEKTLEIAAKENLQNSLTPTTKNPNFFIIYSLIFK